MSAARARSALRSWLSGSPAPRLAAPAAAAETTELGGGSTDQAGSDAVAHAIELLARLTPAEMQRHGYHLQRRDFYSGLNDIEFLLANRDLWQSRPLPAGINWDLSEQMRLFRTLARYAPELRDVPVDPAQDAPVEFHWNNNFWRSTDALVHYGLLRHLAPARVVEIGCGWSSLLMKRALASNGDPCSVHQIEPYPREELMAALPPEWTRETAILQRASPAPIEELQAGDVLFYDGSHVARVASDVNWFFFEVLPRVAPGVLIHAHDVFLPEDYPEEWIVERGQTWNEQYVLEAFLMYNSEFSPLLANAALLAAHREEVTAAIRSAGDSLISAGSFWIVRGAAPTADS